jgi:uracil-DNA glycosylase
MRDRPDRAALEALLAFYVESGVDCLVDELPHDRFAEDGRPAPVTRTAPSRESPAERARVEAVPARRPLPGAAAAPPDVIAETAREQARTAKTLEELEALLRAFEGCALKFTAKNLAFADGTPGSRVMLVGEAPGADEDRVGRPFVGRAGQLLDRMLAAIGLDRSQVYIANIVPWRPPGNRTPTPQETQVCLPFIQRHIELVNPDVLVTLGNPSTQTLLSTREGIMRTRGRWFDYETGGRTIRALPTFHPAYLLRSPSYKRLAWQDLRAIAKVLAGA